jgi:hypothetical protein
MGLAKYSAVDEKWQTFPWIQNDKKSNNVNDYSWTVKLLLQKFSDPHRDFLSLYHLPTSMYMGFPWNYNVHFFPLIDVTFFNKTYYYIF